MNKIKSIQFVNYKAFYGEGEHNKLIIPNGNNVLIYGENGSGKSSIYEGLKQFFNSSDNTIEVLTSKHILVPDEIIIEVGTDNERVVLNNVSVSIIFELDDGEECFSVFGREETTTFDALFIRRANLLNSFISYRELLKTHLIENLKDRYDFRKKFAHLLIETLLGKSINSVTTQPYLNNWRELFRPRARRENKINLLERFDRGLLADINKINSILNFLLKYFDKDLEIQIIHHNAYIEYDYIINSLFNTKGYQNYPEYEIDLRVSLFGNEIEVGDENHLTVLNEARLTALAISIYLASIITRTQDNFEYKILFLDDIFIGLDMSNRLPLIEILSKFKKPILEQEVNPVTGQIEENLLAIDGKIQFEAEPFFKDYQIFITTYDKHWFEIAKNSLNDKWLSVELYSNKDYELGFDRPLIMSPSLNYFQKAELYFNKNKSFKDYPAAANYLRKECEQQLKRLLYGNYLLKNGDNGTTLLREELNELKISFLKLSLDIGLDVTEFSDFDKIIKATLNPLSHDNLQKPIYKTEIEEAFILILNLKNIQKTIFLKKGYKLTHTTDNNGTIRITTLKIASDVYSYIKNGNITLTNIILKPLNQLENLVITNLSNINEISIEKAYDMIYHNVFNIENASIGIELKEVFFDKNNKSISDLLSEII